MIIKNTIQRTVIVKYLMSVDTHPTAEQVYKVVKKQIPTITLATVYRNLNGLASRKEVLRLEINKEYRFDADVSSHQHCVCSDCGKITDCFNEKISNYALDKMQNESFSPDSVSIIFSGLCKNCKGGKK